ncbi:MAG TPA: hypothetical protein VKV23_11315, partial [Acidimicrobiales bacterium]|nr:hypothetical protein [Acidimicrobiales bacterium]
MATVAVPAPLVGRQSPFIDEDLEARIFRVHRDAFRSQAVFDRERSQIWNRCWLYLGHASELPN